MEFLGIGPLELLFIILIIIIVVGPSDIAKTARSLGRGLNALYKSEGWKTFNEVSKQFRGLPSRLAREAELEELQKAAQDIKETLAAAAPNLSAWTAAGGQGASGTQLKGSIAGTTSSVSARAPDGKDTIESPSGSPQSEPDPGVTAEDARPEQADAPLTNPQEASTGPLPASRGASRVPAP